MNWRSPLTDIGILEKKDKDDEMRMKLIKKLLVQLCIGIAIVCIGMLIWKGNWSVLPGWIAGLCWAIGWRMEISESEFQRREATYWKNMWMNDRYINLDEGFGETEVRPRYVTQKEIDERKRRIMEFDFDGKEKGKENPS